MPHAPAGLLLSSAAVPAPARPALLLSLVALLAPSASAPAAPRPSPGPVKLVVIVAVDGLSWPRLNTYRRWFSGGFARLLAEGQVETNCHYLHLNTETCPGHASLATGAPPRVHGVVANRWFELDPDGTGGLISVYCTDQQLPTYQTPPKPPAKIPGPVKLRVSTLGDRLVEASPGSRVVALAGKDRSAIFLAGKSPVHVVYWYDRESGRFTSSAAYDATGDAGRAAADLVRQFNTSQAGWRLLGRFRTTWSPLPEPVAGPDLPRPAANLARFQMPDLGIGFDHDLTRDPRGYFNAVYSSPYQDQLLTELALAFLRDSRLSLGGRPTPDLLALSYSAHDVVSHSFGNESEEALDALRRLDRELGRLLTRLEEIAAAEPRGQVVLALSSDHGFGPLPEVVRRESRSRTGGRLLATDTSADSLSSPFPNFQERLNGALAQELCLAADAQPIFGVEGWTLVYDPRPIRTRPDCVPAEQLLGAADLDRVLEQVIARLFAAEVGDVLLNSERERWPADDAAASFARNDFDAERSGSAFLIPRENVLMAFDAARGSGHGSHHPYDTNVPLIFWGGPFRAGERTATTTPYDLAPTLADLLGIPLPDATGSSRLGPPP
jgi:Type I phosphodiesterase / nucleotide pyrophosphatase